MDQYRYAIMKIGIYNVVNEDKPPEERVYVERHVYDTEADEWVGEHGKPDRWDDYRESTWETPLSEMDSDEEKGRYIAEFASGGRSHYVDNVEEVPGEIRVADRGM